MLRTGCYSCHGQKYRQSLFYLPHYERYVTADDGTTAFVCFFHLPLSRSSSAIYPIFHFSRYAQNVTMMITVMSGRMIFFHLSCVARDVTCLKRLWQRSYQIFISRTTCGMLRRSYEHLFPSGPFISRATREMLSTDSGAPCPASCFHLPHYVRDVTIR